MHHEFASKYLIETLYSLGFSTSYPEVQKFEACAAAQRILLPDQPSESFIQFVADNVDHDLHTLDGYDTFHGMGMIATVTPGSVTSVPIERKSVSFEEIKSYAKVDIQYYKQSTDRVDPLVYEELREINAINRQCIFDHAFLLTWSLRSPTPSWSGLVRMVHCGSHPGKTAIYFLPMIDMNPSDITCVYSTMLFICQQASKQSSTPVLTFDQPLYWKAKMISHKCEPGDPVRNIVLRIGGFHLKMSYLGCIGHIMSGSGIKEVMELIYASNAVSHILTGKAVARAVRGHMLVDTAL
ncbi:hypothetical protein FSP39_010049 [Pinctada imbricata]|uniref:Uncharacterized protein n=1 Tax=Pinctada imbricata TaxID=66713 RepID=A0AA89C927_PINIB|nr:hypothetical protein FSP39_010049 [Pinctada imbricata]